MRVEKCQHDRLTFKLRQRDRPTKLIREDEKKTGKHIPIIALTARAMDEDRKKFLGSGMDDYVSKPIDRQKLFEVVQNLFKKGRFS